eukprot:2760083-Amphidinium_carterae.2
MPDCPGSHMPDQCQATLNLLVRLCQACSAGDIKIKSGNPQSNTRGLPPAMGLQIRVSHSNCPCKMLCEITQDKIDYPV